MTDYERPQTAKEFLRAWYVLAEANNTTQLEQWERQLPDLAKTAPDMTLDILRELAASDACGAKEAVPPVHESTTMSWASAGCDGHGALLVRGHE